VGVFIAGHGVWDEDLKNIPTVYDEAGGAFIIAETQGRIVGMGALRRVNGETAEIKRMRVQPEFQGQGLGTRMLKLLESKAKEFGYVKLILDTSLLQQAALHIYSKYGYKEYKRGELGGLTTVWMEKDIS
jgi:ribosomal protein S18 acetylase RimI-like enzyme